MLPARSVHVFGISLLRYAWPIVELDVHCGKGTYIRGIARDLGQHLGTGGHCSSIRRTAVGPFTIEMAEPLERIPEPLTERNLMMVEQALHIVQDDAAASDV